MQVRVLDVGQCGFDHAAIADFLQHIVSAHVDIAGTAAETEKLLQQTRYNLVLINRILDRDGSSGIDLIKQLRQVPNCPPLMLVSNLPDAQAKAIAAGAVQGFGKSAIHLPQTAEHLREILAADIAR
jgi:DNA-binding response OmpR family regulator